MGQPLPFSVWHGLVWHGVMCALTESLTPYRTSHPTVGPPQLLGRTWPPPPTSPPLLHPPHAPLHLLTFACRDPHLPLPNPAAPLCHRIPPSTAPPPPPPCSTLHGLAAAQGAHADNVLLLVLCVGSLRSHVGTAPASELQQQLEQQQRSSTRCSNLVRARAGRVCSHACTRWAGAGLGVTCVHGRARICS